MGWWELNEWLLWVKSLEQCLHIISARKILAITLVIIWLGKKVSKSPNTVNLKVYISYIRGLCKSLTTQEGILNILSQIVPTHTNSVCTYVYRSCFTFLHNWSHITYSTTSFRLLIFLPYFIYLVHVEHPSLAHFQMPNSFMAT